MHPFSIHHLFSLFGGRIAQMLMTWNCFSSVKPSKAQLSASCTGFDALLYNCRWLVISVTFKLVFLKMKSEVSAHTVGRTTGPCFNKYGRNSRAGFQTQYCIGLDNTGAVPERTITKLHLNKAFSLSTPTAVGTGSR